MKKIIYSLVVVGLAGCIIIACKKEINNVPGAGQLKADKTEIDVFQKSGEKHNQALDYVYAALLNEKQKKKGDLSEEELINITIQSSMKFIETDFNINEDSISNMYSKIGLLNLNKSKSDGLTMSFANNTLRLDTIKDKEYRQYLNQILDLVENDSLSTELLFIELERIEGEVMDKSCKDEVMSISSIIKSSTNYWKENFNKWMVLFGGKTTKAVDPRFWRIMEADAQGAFGGALGFGPFGAMFGAMGGSSISGLFIVFEEATKPRVIATSTINSNYVIKPTNTQPYNIIMR